MDTLSSQQVKPSGSDAELLELLKAGPTELVFTKADGSKRVMVATLNEHLIPHIAGKSVPRKDCVTVWDLENAGWRAVKPSKLLQPPVSL